MAALFDLKGGQVVLNAESLAIPIFNKIWKRDRTKAKDQANKDVAYIFFMCDFNSLIWPILTRNEEKLF